MGTIKDVEQFWDKRPCNVRHSDAKVGTDQYFLDVTQRRYTVEYHIVTFADFMRWRDKKVLDLGCGIGTDAREFAKFKAKVTAVDLSKKSIEIAKKAKVKGIRYKQVNIEELSKAIKPKPYDLIWSFGVLHHTPNPEKAVEEIKKFCDKDTILKVMLYNKYSWKAFWLWVKDHSFTNSEAQQGSPVTYTYSKKEARELFKDFEILNMEVDFIFPYKVDKYINYEYVYPWYWFILKHFQKWLGWHILMTMKLK